MSAILNGVYNHYLTTYAPKGTSRFDTHKKSELRSVYNSMVKLNKESPWYLPTDAAATQAYAIGLKESARDLRNTIASLGGLEEEQLLGKKVATSSNEDVISATYIGQFSPDDILPTIEMEVQRLASPQKNLGLYLADTPVALEPDTYSFDVSISGLNYEFQFSIKEGETHKEVQERLVRLISNADIGIKADLHEADDTYALRLASDNTGSETGAPIFTISDHQTSKRSGTVAYFGLDYISSPPSNALFTINGEDRSTTSNHFTVGHMYDVTLKGVSSEGEAVTLGLKTDYESLAENVKNLIGGYNSFVKAVHEYQDRFPRSTKLSREMTNISSLYLSEFQSMGLRLQEDSTLAVDDNLLARSFSEEGVHDVISTIKNFASSLVRKTSQISIDPMHYVDKKIVAYKNPGKTFASPYTPSPYSGMMFNGYI
ncbi:MAG: flagellar filament capping protein FliD [Lachnospiraceae bacterium]|nr:flagellar filament capping protein FliD [Lachnospiraceae bacterium]